MTIQRHHHTAHLVEHIPETVFAGASRTAHYSESADSSIQAIADPSESVTIEPPTERDAAKPQRRHVEHEIGRIALAPEVPIAQKGLRGALAKVGLRPPPGRGESAALERQQARAEHERIVRQATWTRAVSILVANPKGGVGKTPTAIILGGILASIRGGSVCVMEVADDPGALAYRAEGNPTLGVGELVRDLGTIRSAGQLAGYTAPQTSFAAIIGTAKQRPRLESEDVTAAAAIVDEYYAIRVMDSGNQPSSAAFNAALDTADQLVIPVLNAGDAAIEAANLLRSLRDAGGRRAELAANAVLLRSSDGRPETPEVVAAVDELLEDADVHHIFTIPYDAHIAERGQITLGRLAPETTDAFTAAAATVIRSLQSSIR